MPRSGVAKVKPARVVQISDEWQNVPDKGIINLSEEYILRKEAGTLEIDSRNKVIKIDGTFMNFSLREFHQQLRDHCIRSKIPGNELPYSFDKERNLIFIKKDWTIFVRNGDY